MSSTAAHVSCVSAVVLAILWLLCLTCSGSWVSSLGVMVNFSATPFKVKSEQGGFTGLMTWTASMVGLKKKAAMVQSTFNRELWLDDAMQLYCNAAIEEIFRWCHSWVIVAFSSWAMVFCGSVAALSFVVGAMFMFFYTSVQATELGRKCVKSCFILAPAIATVGVAQYTLGTLDFGQDSAVLAGAGLGGGADGGLASQTMFGIGFIFACVLVVFSWVPLYAMMIVFRPDPWEVSDSEYDSSGDEAARKRGAAAGGYGATGYAAAGGYGAYGGYPASGGYGAAAEMLPQNPQYQQQGPQFQNFSYAGQQPNYGGAYGGSPPQPYHGGGLGGSPGGRP